ncbi:MAG: TetR/AcrR family transcriptional regulator [bacterium]|nr:TetR/AcrR family transcriptional regulator [bacterium]
MELSQRILDATIEEFNEKGMKFTMDDIAKRLGISKKTLYTVFKDKETLFLEMVDYCFDEIKQYKDQLLMDDDLDALTKLKQVMIALPEKLQGLDWRQIYLLREKYPGIYKVIEQKLENGWEPIEELYNQARSEGKVRNLHFVVVKAIVESSIEHFIGNSMLIEQNITYQESLGEMIDIVIDGISSKESKV